MFNDTRRHFKKKSIKKTKEKNCVDMSLITKYVDDR